ncbi:MAG: 50S ribosomal protein L9 [Elusimicrobiota bacterium]
MKVILKQKVDKLGQEGDIKEVKPGYFKNYLLPKKLVLPATPENLKIVQREKDLLLNRIEQERLKMKDTVDKLRKVSVNIGAKTGETGKLFGSITKEDISDVLNKETGMQIDKHDILLDEPFKETGVYFVDVKLRSEKFPGQVFENVKIKVWVVES